MSTEFATPDSAEAVTPESAPVETVVNEAPGAVEAESAPAEEVESKVPKHIEELKSQRKKRQIAEQEAAYWRGQAEARGAAVQQPEPQAVPQREYAPIEPVAPTYEQFESYDEYERAKDTYLVQMAEHRLYQKLQEQRAREAQQHQQAMFQQRLAQAAETDPTILDIVTDKTLPVSDAMAQLIQQSDSAPQILKWLDNNRKEAGRIAAMHPIMAARELGIVEARLQSAPKPAPPKTVSMAPEPIQTVNSIGATDPNPDSLPIEEWMKKFGAPTKRR